ncbi:MAG: ABC transporter permease [Tissierellia bacterium]|nr:ABC transporter permease [Tissierellia bacterium]
MVNKKFSNKILLALVYIFLYAPIAVLIFYSFNESRLRGSFTGFSLKWYRLLFEDPEIISALYNTIMIAILSTLISTVLGTFASIGIYSTSSRKAKLILNINYLPVLNPDIVTAVSLMALFKFMSLKFGFNTMLISHIIFSTPYVVLSILPKLKQINPHLIEAALDLGAKPFYAIVKIIIPEIMPGIVNGALMAFTLSIDDFVISFFNTGHGVSNLSIAVYSMAKRGINPSINALSTIMFAVMISLLLVINRRTKEEVSV